MMALSLQSCKDPSCTGLAPYSQSSEWVAPKRTLARFQHKVTAKPPECQFPNTGSPLTVFQAIDVALSNNPDTAITWANARAAAYGLGAAESAYYPFVAVQETLYITKQSGQTQSSVSGVNGAFSGDIGGTGGATYFETLISQLFISYLIADFGGRCASVAMARELLYQANWLHNRELQTVMFNVLDAYYKYLGDVAAYLARLSDLEDAAVTLDAAENMQAVGVKTIADVLQAKANFSGVRLEVEKALSTMKTAMGRLARQLGLPADYVLDVQMLPEELQTNELNESIEQLMTVAQTQRPDLAATYANVREKQANLKSVQSSALPTLSALGSVERDTYLNASQFNGTIYNSALQLRAPIFVGFLFSNQIRQAKEQVRAAFAQMWNKEYDIYLEVLEAYYSYQTALANITYSEDFLKFSKQNYDVAFGNYKEGTGTILDLLNAQDTLAKARAQSIEARTLWLTSIADIAYSTGTIGCQY